MLMPGKGIIAMLKELFLNQRKIGSRVIGIQILRDDEIALDITPPILIRGRRRRAEGDKGNLIHEFDRFLAQVNDADVIEFLGGQMTDDILGFLPLIDQSRIGKAFDFAAFRVGEKEDEAFAPMKSPIVKARREFAADSRLAQGESIQETLGREIP